MKPKKILALVLSMLMVLAAFPLATFAAADADAPIARYNLGVSTVPEKENWIPVDQNTSYNAERGYGLDPALTFSSSNGRNRGAVDGLYYDPMTSSWLGSDNWSFFVDIPNGSYDVVIFCADMNGDNASNMAKATKNGTRFTIEGVQHEYLHIQTAKLPKVDGIIQPYFITYPVTVTDGQLNIQVGGLTEAEKKAVLAQINVYDPEFDVTYNWGNAVQGYINGIAIYNAGKAPTALADLLSASGTGSVTPPVETYDVTVVGGTANPANAEAGTAITVTATVPQGKRFVSWTVNAGTVTPTGSTSLTTETLTFNMPAEAVSLTANFEDIPASTYDVTVVGGTANPANAEAGTAITVTATVPQGKRFVSWTVNAGTVTPTGGTSLTTETLTFNMPAEAVSLTANFEDIPAPTYDVTVVGGTASPAKAEAGTAITVTADVPQGKRFVSWTVNAGTVTPTGGTSLTTETLTFNMPAEAVSLTANFEDIPPAPTYDVTVVGGTASPAKAEAGTAITVTADVPQGKRFVSWTVNAGTVTPTGSTSLTTETLTFNMPAEAVSLTANFEDIPTPPVGEITVVSDKKAYAPNETIVVTITTPDTVKKAYLVAENGNGLATARNVTVNDNGTATWVLTFSLGSKGNRVLTVYTDGVATDKTVSFVVDTGAPVEQGEVKIINATMDTTGKVNETLTATIKTSTSVTKVRLFNESGMGLAPSSCTYVDEGGVRTWTYTLSVGTPGTRNFVVKVAGADMAWADATETLSTRITRS